MSKIKKRLIFFGALVAFFTISPLVVLFARGARLNFSTREINSTGGIYLKAYDNGNYNAFLEGKKRGDVPVFISGLSPQAYKLQLKKEGYKKWEKKLCVEPYRVTKLRNILLVPEEPYLKKLESKKVPKEKKVYLKQDLLSGYKLRGETEKKLFFQGQAKTDLVLENIDEFKVAPTKDKAFFKKGNGETGIIWLQKDYWFNKDRAEIDYFNLESVREVDWLKEGLHLVYQKGNELYLKRVSLRSNCNEKKGRPVSPRLLIESLEDFRFDWDREVLLVKKKGQWFQYSFNLAH